MTNDDHDEVPIYYYIRNNNCNCYITQQLIEETFFLV